MPPERWLELTVQSPLGPELVSPVLLELGGSAVEERDGALVTYLPPPPELDLFIAKARGRLQELAPFAEPALSWRWQPQKDWETYWRRGLGIRKITSRLVVSPSWEEAKAREGEILIILDPGMAFGTAEHATTRGCLRILDERVTPGSRIADVGSGSGILSIAAARLGAVEVLAIEMDGPSCETALENLSRNGVEDRVTVLQGEVKGEGPLPRAPFDGIVANLQSHLLLPLFSVFRRSLAPDGWLVVSGILVGEKDQLLSSASGEGFVILSDDEEEGWWTGNFRVS